VNRFLSSPDAPERTPDVRLFEGDAIWRPGHRDREHPLSPQSGHEFDNILALDCAYHFDPRREFLRQSFQRLAPGGSVALADICFSSPPRATLKYFLSGVLHVMPRSNMVTKEQYEQQMYEIGYENIGVEDITPFVFPGFRAFLKQRGILWGVFAGIMGWLQGRGLCFVIIEGRKPFVR
jgi:SAM-dependent methyltransferase